MLLMTLISNDVSLADTFATCTTFTFSVLKNMNRIGRFPPSSIGISFTLEIYDFIATAKKPGTQIIHILLSRLPHDLEI